MEKNGTYDQVAALLKRGGQMAREDGRLRQIYKELTVTQRKYIEARLEHSTVKGAADAVGIAASTAYQWKERDLIDEAIELIQAGTAYAVKDLMSLYLYKAAMVKVEALESDDEKVRQSAATEILDRFLGRASQPVQHKVGLVTEDITEMSDDELRSIVET